MLESKVEDYMRREAEKRGCMFMKFVSPQLSGVPDRILLHPSLRRTTFIEMKRPGGTARKLQLQVHKILRAHGADVHVIPSIEDVDEFFVDFDRNAEGSAKGK